MKASVKYQEMSEEPMCKYFYEKEKFLRRLPKTVVSHTCVLGFNIFEDQQSSYKSPKVTSLPKIKVSFVLTLDL